tara:strand:- start:421 stop:1515 length:1095 start_codon:yes stop_codon:yes gene_type:complete
MSHTNLVTINSTEINNSGPLRVGDDLKSGNSGQVLKSQGDGLAPEWGADTDTTYQGSATININPFTTPYTINCLKVPNTLTFTGYDTGTFDGSSALSINLVDTNTTYTGTTPIDISPSNVISIGYDDDTIILDGGELGVDHVPNALTAGTNISFSSGSTYDGSAALTFNLDTDIEDMREITYESGFFATSLTGNDYPGSETTCTYLDLTSATNILPAAVSPFLGTKIQQTYIAKSFSTTYAEYSSNFRMSFVAQSANALVEFQAVIAAYSKIFYGALYDYNAGSFWTTPQTQTRFKYDNGVDQDPTTLYWYLTGLTAGNTYYISPYFKGSAAYVYVYAGNGGIANQFAPGIFRVSDGGANVGVY